MRASLSQMVMQKDSRIYPSSGKRRPSVQRGGGESLYYFAPKCLYRGGYKRDMECGNSTAYECGHSRPPLSVFSVTPQVFATSWTLGFELKHVMISGDDHVKVNP